MAFRLALEFSPKVLRLSLLRLSAFFSRADFILLTGNLAALLKARIIHRHESVHKTFSAPATVITAKESRRMPVTPEPEPFVSADEAAQFLCVKRRYLLELARRGIAGAYALGTGGKRKIWLFRLTELANSVVRNETSIPKPPNPCTIGPGSPR
jgi:hypothetical protein